MTRHDLLAQIEAHTQQQRGQALRTAGAVALFTIAGLWMLSTDKAALGLAALLFFGVGGGVGVILRLTAPRPTYGGGRLEAHPAPVARLGMVVLMLASLAGVVAFVVGAHGVRQVEMALLGAAWMVIVLLVLMSFLRRGPVLTVDADGYFDRRASHAAIPWERMLAVDVITVKKQSFYRLQFLGNDRLTLLARLNRLVGIRGISIGCAGLNVCDGDVLLAIQAYRPALLDALVERAA